jgi:hypothetical protein
MARTTAGTEMEQAWADAWDEFTEPRRAEIVLTYCVSSAGVAKFSMPQPEEEGGTGAPEGRCYFVLSSSMLSSLLVAVAMHGRMAIYGVYV